MDLPEHTMDWPWTILLELVEIETDFIKSGTPPLAAAMVAEIIVRLKYEVDNPTDRD